MQTWMIVVVVMGAAVAIWLMMPKRRDTLEVGGAPANPPAHPQPRPLSAPAPTRSAADEIEKLWRLKEDGALSSEEFETQKEKLLAGEPVTGAAAGYQLVLTSEGRNKIAVIKRVREITQLGLKEAKDLVESPPQVIAEGLTAQQAETMRQGFIADGATVEVR